MRYMTLHIAPALNLAKNERGWVVRLMDRKTGHEFDAPERWVD